MARWIRRSLTFGVGYLVGRSYAQAWLDRARPAELRAMASSIERHQYVHDAAPRRSPSFRRRRVGAGSP